MSADVLNSIASVPESWDSREDPIIFAHHLPDGSWWFDTIKSRDHESVSRISKSLAEISSRDPSISSISDMMVGDRAIRVMHQWKRLDSDKPMEGEYLSGHNEWMNNQYNDGHFTGGIVPKWMSNPGSPKLQGYLYLVSGIICAGIFFSMLTEGLRVRGMWDVLLMAFGAGAFLRIAYLRLSKSSE